MRSYEPVRLGVIGSGWITEQHLAAFARLPQIEVVALADYPRDRGGRPGRGRALAAARSVPEYFEDYRAMLERPDVEAVTVSLPNALHAEVTLAALNAGKHAIVEKPLCLSLADADRIVALAAERNLQVGYAEELCFCPKFVRAKALIEQGAIGELFWLKQVEAHEGPYSEWFFDPQLGGGGALIDMGCHSIEYARWMYNKAKVERVTAHLANYAHPNRAVDDHCVLHLEFEGGRAALVEAGWNLKGGMDSVSHLRGSEGVLEVDLLKGNGMRMFSAKSGEDWSEGWSTPDYEWLWQNGYPQEMAEFAEAIRQGRAPSESAEDGRAVLEIMWAAYASAAEGRAVRLPYKPPEGVQAPVQLWRRA